MNDWLSEIEEHVGEWAKYDHLSSTWFTEDIAMMTRVIRELVAELKNAYYSIDAARDDLPHEKYDAEALLHNSIRHRGSPLSPDAKELLK